MKKLRICKKVSKLSHDEDHATNEAKSTAAIMLLLDWIKVLRGGG